MAKLTEAKIKEIRRRYANREANQNELAAEYNTSQANISLIVLRKHWGWLK
jgi:transcriptional regulator